MVTPRVFQVSPEWVRDFLGGRNFIRPDFGNSLYSSYQFLGYSTKIHQVPNQPIFTADSFQKDQKVQASALRGCLNHQMWRRFQSLHHRQLKATGIFRNGGLEGLRHSQMQNILRRSWHVHQNSAKSRKSQPHLPHLPWIWGFCRIQNNFQTPP